MYNIMENLNTTEFSKGLQINQAHKLLEKYKVVFNDFLYENGILYFIAYSSTNSAEFERYHYIVINTGLASLIYHNSNVTDNNRKVDFNELKSLYKNELKRTLAKL